MRYNFTYIKKGGKIEIITFIPKKLARLADVADNTIIKIETGKNQNPMFDTLEKITKILKASVDDLIN